MNDITKSEQKASAPQKIRNEIETRKDQFVAALNGDRALYEKFLGACGAAMVKNPELGKLPQESWPSLLASCLDAARDGLLPDGREAALVTFKTKATGANGQDVWINKAQYMPMVAGLKKRLYATGEVSNVSLRVVYKNDFFEYDAGDEERIVHRPAIDGDPGAIVAAYSIVTFKDGSKSREVMGVNDINRAKAKSKNAGKFWAEWYDEMAKKTVFRRHFKSLPQAQALAEIIEREDERENAFQDEEVRNVTAKAPQLSDFAEEGDGDDMLPGENPTSGNDDLPDDIF